ncbi:ABC transporter permease [Zavarzinella formosa]|uniref:ABC transporter permease n=1 Tax=Zavarzinella formosa TaxID=360055 RepID=UPI0002F616E8|nr:ABC transporter permease [Zavarzinella formosa]
MTPSRFRPYLLASPAIVLLLGFFLAPMLQLGRVSLYDGGGRSGFGIGGGGFYKPNTWTFQAYRTLAGETYFREVWTFTVLLGLGVACITLLIAYPLSLFIHRLPPRAKALALTAVVLPKLANVLVLIYGLELLLSNSGPVNGLLVGLGAVSEPVAFFHNLPGVLIGETYLILPYAVLALVASLDRIDPALVPAARGLGAGPLRVFWRVTLPLSAPGIALAAMLSLIWALGAFTGPVLLGSPQELTLAVEVQRQTFENLNWPRGAATAVLMLVTLAACLVLYQVPARFLRRRGGAP